MQKVATFLDSFTSKVSYVSIFSLIGLMLLVAYDALMRYVFKSGLVALQELEWHLFCVMFLVGMSYTLKTDKHVRLDLFYARYSLRLKSIINLISNLFFIIPFSVVIIYFSIGFVEMSYMQNESSPSGAGLCCRYIIKSAIIVGFALLIIQSLSEVIKNIISLKKY